MAASVGFSAWIGAGLRLKVKPRALKGSPVRTEHVVRLHVSGSIVQHRHPNALDVGRFARRTSHWRVYVKLAAARTSAHDRFNRFVEAARRFEDS